MHVCSVHVFCTHVCSPGNLIDPHDDILSYKTISWQISLTLSGVHFVPAPPLQGNSLQPSWYLHKWVLATKQVTAIRHSNTSSWLLWVNHWCKGLLSCLKKDLWWSGTLQELLCVASAQTFSGLGTNLSTSIARVGIDPPIAYAWRPYKWNEWQGQHSSSMLPKSFWLHSRHNFPPARNE